MGYLDLMQAKMFFALIFDLNYHHAKDRATFRKIMRLVDVDA